MSLIVVNEPVVMVGTSLDDRPAASKLRPGVIFVDQTTGSVYMTVGSGATLAWMTLVGPGALSSSYLLKFSGILEDGASDADLADTGGSPSDAVASGVVYPAVVGAARGTGSVYIQDNTFVTATELRIGKNGSTVTTVPILAGQTGLINFAVNNLDLVAGDTLVITLHAATPGGPGELIHLAGELLLGNA